jgi:hypothetical protein
MKKHVAIVNEQLKKRNGIDESLKLQDNVELMTK